MRKLTNEEFISKAISLYGDKYDYSKSNYISSRKKICIICPTHGEFWQLANNHLRGHGCPFCYTDLHTSEHKKCTHKKFRVTNIEQFIQKANLVHGSKYDYSKVQYINSSTKVCIICKDHGEFWQTPNRHLSGNGCPKCKYIKQSNQQRKTKDQFISQANQVHNYFYDYSKVNYINSRTKIIITCPKHGDFLQDPHEHLSGCGCKKCKCKTQTKIFNKLSKIVPDLQFEVTKSIVPWIGNLRLDMYSKKYNFAVECDGEQHYRPISLFGGEYQFALTVKRDALKNKLCEQNGCKLFRINANYTTEQFDMLMQTIQNIINLYQYESK